MYVGMCVRPLAKRERPDNKDNEIEKERDKRYKKSHI